MLLTDSKERGPYEESYEPLIPTKFLQNPVSDPSDTTGRVTMQLSFITPGEPGSYQITFFCEGVESEAVTMQVTSSGFDLCILFFTFFKLPDFFLHGRTMKNVKLGNQFNPQLLL